MSDPPPPSYPASASSVISHAAGSSSLPGSSAFSETEPPPPPDANRPWTDEIAFVAFLPRSRGSTPAPTTPSSSTGSPTRARSSFPSSELIDLTGLNDSKPKLHVVLAERCQFVRPPQGYYSSDGSYQFREEGRISRVMGFCHISLPERKLVKSVRVLLNCTQRLIFPDGVRSHWEESNVFRKEVVYEGTGKEKETGGSFYLERGVSSFEFMIQIPSTSPCRDYCRSGSVSWEVLAAADLVKEKPSSKGGGLLSKLAAVPSAGVGLLEDRQELYLYSIPSDEALQFSTSDRFHSPFFGLYDFSMAASALIVAGPLSINFTLHSVPPDITIFAIRAYVRQTVRISAPPDRQADILGPQRTVAWAGPKSGWDQPGFAEKARKGARKGEGVLLDTRRAGGRDGEMVGKSWSWEKIGRLPASDRLRPTTESGTKTSLRFKVELAVEVCFNTVENPTIQVATLFRDHDVRVGSCCSTLPRLIVPDYSDVPQDESRKISWKQPPSLLCRCFDPWEEVERRERAFLDGQGPRTPDLVVPSLNPSTEERTRGRKVGELAPSDPIGRRGSEPDASRGKMTRG